MERVSARGAPRCVAAGWRHPRSGAGRRWLASSPAVERGRWFGVVRGRALASGRERRRACAAL